VPAPWQYLVHHYAVFAANWVIPFLVQRWDRRRLTPAQRAQAWNGASWGAAIYNLGPLSMLGWAWVTRHEWSSWRRQGLAHALVQAFWLLFAGLRAGVVLTAVVVGVDRGLVALLGLPH
jgi:hypothetical protein